VEVDGDIWGQRGIRAGRADIVVAATLGENLDFQPVRTMIGVLTNAFLIAVYTATRFEVLEGADVVIEPDLEVHNHWDVRQQDDLVAKGRLAAAAAVPRIRAKLGQFTGAG
jgi:hypothetical protein